MPDASAITALLGPTNTGKTHRAVERMLEHGSGMIGLPLRLLAREVYDKISAKVGESRVALVTGEEQRVPARPAYWVATVEAMPTAREVEFVAVDEVQLAAHEQRGHVFTSRLLGARGAKETWLLGADTMRPVLAELVPTAKHVEHPRLSRLAFAGAQPLTRVPERSAVVAFSMNHCYEIAERLRARKGGAAVVLGALSPRTRNAQVAMFQAGEVDFLVATDAVGMGLNLDVQHVAFAATRKFDGRDVRDVDDAELAQIAGRAGRWVRDGTFGTVSPLELAGSTAASIEAHRFDAVRRVRWRNDDLSFSSIDELRASLGVRPKRALLVPTFDAEDARSLARLAAREDVVSAARREDEVRLLWDVCTIPDFRKFLFEAHVDLLGELFLELARRGSLSDDWIAARVRSLDDTSGDVETLVSRIAATRTWTYVANRQAWLESPRDWQETTLALEDRLSDALHARLVMRFVDVKKARSAPRARSPGPASNKHAPVDGLPPRVPAGHPFAKLATMRIACAERPPSVEREPGWVEDVIAAAHDDFRLEGTGRIVHVPSQRGVGALVRGPSIALPDVRLVEGLDLGAGAKSRLSRRLVAFARDVVATLLGDLRTVANASASASARGLVHRLEQGLGTALARETADVCGPLTREERDELARAGLSIGGCVVWLPSGLATRALTARVALTSTYFEVPLRLPAGGAVSFSAPRRVDPRAFTAIGHPVFGPRAVRADIAERAHAVTRQGDGEDDVRLANRLGCPRREVPRVLAELSAGTAAGA